MSGAPAKDLTDLATSIYEGADGYWHAKVPIRRRPDGYVERKHLKRRREEDLRAAVVALAAPRNDEPALPVVKRPEELTLADWVDRWLNERLPLAGRAHKTIYGYRSELNNHVLPDTRDVPAPRHPCGQGPASAGRDRRPGAGIQPSRWGATDSRVATRASVSRRRASGRLIDRRSMSSRPTAFTIAP